LPEDHVFFAAIRTKNTTSRAADPTQRVSAPGSTERREPPQTTALKEAPAVA